jgi:NADH-quinone oxidoreductase subunit H
VTFVPVFMTLLALPYMEGWGVRDLQLGLFYIVAVSGVTVIGYIMAGWASDNKYALLGAVRSAAQLISYELPLILAVLGVSMVAGSLNLNDIVRQQDDVPYLLLQPLPFLILLTATLAELSRRPFDIPIGESELVGGPWVEYSGIRWSIIFALTEYAGLWGMSILGALVFMGGWEFPFGTASFWGDFDFLYQLVLVFSKSFFLILTMMWISATFPRLRIDQLMAFCWKILLPFGFLQVIINAIVLVYLDDEVARDVVLFLTSSALLVAMSYAIYMATRQPSREERLAGIIAARSPAQ